VTLRDQIRRAASRKVGMLTSDIADFTVHQVGLACFKMAAKGELHKVKLGRRAVRFFTDPLLADALRERVRTEQARLAHLGVSSAAPSAKAWPEGAEAVITEKTVFTQCPSFTPQHAGLCGNADHVYGGNQRGRVTPRHLVLERMRAAP
jgi:hypothetical protein